MKGRHRDRKTETERQSIKATEKQTDRDREMQKHRDKQIYTLIEVETDRPSYRDVKCLLCGSVFLTSKIETSTRKLFTTSVASVIKLFTDISYTFS